MGFEATMNGGGRDRLVGDSLKGSGSLGRSLGLTSVNKVNNIILIGGIKLGRTSSSRFRDVGTMFGVKSGYGTMANTSRGWDLNSRMARIKEGEDNVHLAGGESFHVEVQVFVDIYLARFKQFISHMTCGPNLEQMFPQNGGSIASLLSFQLQVPKPSQWYCNKELIISWSKKDII